MAKKIVTLAHYYTLPEVQEIADCVGDSLELALYAKTCKADVIVFAGVKFMAETAKILNPNAKVILPNKNSTCSLVTMTDIAKLKAWRLHYKDHIHVAYINSSIEHKALADWVVTSRNVVDIITHLYEQGHKVIYSPDRNMGAYLNFEFGFNMPLWSAICEVHDKFNQDALNKLFNSILQQKYLIAHPESPLPILKKANFIGSTYALLQWIINYKLEANAVILVATEEGILYNMRKARPDLDIRLAPIYNGCQCNVCPYMKLNTLESVILAKEKGIGFYIDYLNETLINNAKLPLMRMLEFNN